MKLDVAWNLRRVIQLSKNPLKNMVFARKCHWLLQNSLRPHLVLIHVFYTTGIHIFFQLQTMSNLLPSEFGSRFCLSSAMRQQQCPNDDDDDDDDDDQQVPYSFIFIRHSIGSINKSHDNGCPPMSWPATYDLTTASCLSRSQQCTLDECKTKKARLTKIPWSQ